MALTAMLGTPQSQPGAVQPGYFCKGTAVWRGPFPVAELPGPALGIANPIVRKAASPASFSVAPAVASQLASGDLTWWELH